MTRARFRRGMDSKVCPETERKQASLKDELSLFVSRGIRFIHVEAQEKEALSKQKQRLFFRRTCRRCTNPKAWQRAQFERGRDGEDVARKRKRRNVDDELFIARRRPSIASCDAFVDSHVSQPMDSCFNAMTHRVVVRRKPSKQHVGTSITSSNVSFASLEGSEEEDGT